MPISLDVLAQQANRQADAAVQQAQVTRQIFEASNRPYLEVVIDEWSYLFPQTTGFHFNLRFRVMNHGQVPAIFKAWRATVRVAAQIVAQRASAPADSGICVFPDRDTIVQFAVDQGPEAQQPEAEVEVTVEYKGLPGTDYETRVTFVGRRNQWRTAVTAIR